MGRHQIRNQQVRGGRRGIACRHDAQRAPDIPVRQRAARNGSHQDGGDGGGFHQAVGLDQQLRRDQFRENAVLGGRIPGSAQTHQAIGQEGIQPQTHPEGATELQRIADQHHAALGQGTGKGSANDATMM